MTTPNLNPLQQQALDAMRQQHDAYLAAVRSWRDAAGGSVDFRAGMPDFGPMPTFEGLPSPEELAASNQLFMTRMFEDQRRFFESLNDILGRK